MRDPPFNGHAAARHSGGDQVRVKLATMRFRHLLYTSATLATLLLAAGARWKPKN
jgi:hypothetical protein